MDNRADVRDFLRTRRARLTPEQAGLPNRSGTRRVQGLRREEVAAIAGVSVDYYNRMERGSLNGVSESVLEAVANALQLDEDERIYLDDLARMANGTRTKRPATRSRLKASIQLLLDGMTGLPAYVRTSTFDILGANQLGSALMPHLLGPPADAPNLARYIFLDKRAQEFYLDWQTVARDCVAALRIEAGRDPYNRNLTDLVGELSTRSDAFRTWWSAHDVRSHNTATKTLHHPLVGDIQVTGEALTLAADPGLIIIAYTVEPASPAAEAMALLASWSGKSSVRSIEI